MNGEPRGELIRHAPLSDTHAPPGYQRRAAEGAIELHLVDPAIETFIVEHVLAIEPSDAVAVPKAAEAEDADGGVVSTVVVAAAVEGEGGGGVDGELLGKGDDGVVVVVVVAVEVDGVEHGGDEGAEVADGGGD